MTDDVTFVIALPGWEVLYYFKGGRFETAPIVAWGIVVDEVGNGVVRVTPVTTDLAWSLDDERTICTPEGDVTCGDFQRWPNLWEWLADMQRRETEEPDKLPLDRPSPPSDGNAPVVLENYRRRFQRQEGDVS